MSALYQIYHTSGNDGGRTDYIHQVDSPKEAVLALDILAKYDLALGDLIIWNTQGLQVSYDNGANWVEWEDKWRESITTYDYQKVSEYT